MNDEEKDNPRLIMLPLDSLAPPPKPKLTLAQMAWGLVGRFAMAIVIIAVVAYVGMVAWNGLTDQTGLAEISWQDAACAFLLLRIAGMTVFGLGAQAKR